MAGSLLDNEDFSSIGSSRGSSKGGGPKDSAQMIKILIIVVCLGGAGGLFAWQSGMFKSAPKDTRSQDQIQEEEDQFQEQERIREKMKSMPQYQEGDA